MMVRVVPKPGRSQKFLLSLAAAQKAKMASFEDPTVDWGDEDPEPVVRDLSKEPETKRRRLNTVNEQRDAERFRTPLGVSRALKQAKKFEDFRESRCFRFLHLFCGDKDPLGAAIKKEARAARLSCEIVPMDWSLDWHLDLADKEVYRNLRARVEQGDFDGFHAGFPSSSFAAERWEEKSHKAPLRSSAEIYGLATNSPEAQDQTDKATILASQSGWLMQTQIQSARERGVTPVATLVSSPGNDKCGPAWQLPEIKETLHDVEAIRVALNACSYQGKARRRQFRPTLWVGKLEGLQKLARVCRCPAWVTHEPTSEQWWDKRDSLYPEELCSEVAKLVVATWKRTLNAEYWRHEMKVRPEHVPEPQRKWVLNENNRVKRILGKDHRGQAARDNNVKEVMKAETASRQAAVLAERDLPSRSSKDARDDTVVGGMRNPLRSVNKVRSLCATGEKMRAEWEALALEKVEILDAGEDFGSAQAWMNMEHAREWEDRLRTLLSLRPASKCVLKGQEDFASPLKGDMWKAWRRESRDPDASLHQFIEEGAPLGIIVELPPSGIFPKCRDFEIEQHEDMAELRQAEAPAVHMRKVDPKAGQSPDLERLAQRGVVVQKSWDWVRQHLDRHAAENQEARGLPAFSTTKVNLPERIVLPRTTDILETMRELLKMTPLLQEFLSQKYGEESAAEWGDTEFVHFKFKDAPAHFAVDPREWPQCVEPSEDGKHALLWVALLNEHKASTLVMGRLAAACGRLVQSLLKQFEGRVQVYMYSMLAVLRGPKFHRDHLVSMIWHTLEAFGVQIAQMACERGDRVTWMGVTLEIESLELLNIFTPQAWPEELFESMADWHGRKQVPATEIIQAAGKLCVMASTHPRLRWVANVMLGTVHATQLEERRRGKEEEKREEGGEPKSTMVQVMRFAPSLVWIMKLLGGFSTRLKIVRPLMEERPKWGIMTEASPYGLGGVLMQLHPTEDKFLIKEAFEARFIESEAQLLMVEHGAPLSQSVIETLAVLRAIVKWAIVLRGYPFLMRTNSVAVLGGVPRQGESWKTLHFLMAEISLHLEWMDVEKVNLHHLSGKDSQEAEWLARLRERGPMPESLSQAKLMRLGPITRESGLFRLLPPGTAAAEALWSQAQFEGPKVAVKLH